MPLGAYGDQCLLVSRSWDYETAKEGLLKKKWRVVRDAANEEGVGSTETRLSSDLPIGCLKQANVPKHHPEGP